MKKRLLAMLLALVMVMGMLPITASAAGTGITDRLNQLKNEYPDGSYWTVNGGPCPPPDENYNHTDHSNCKFFDDASECMGFARLLFYEIFGIKCSTLDNPQGRRHDVENIAIGDYIRIAGDSHSAIVTGINGDELTVVDCNFGGRCQIKWSSRPDGWKIYKKDITFFIHAPQDVYDRVNESFPQPIPPSEPEAPTLDNDFEIQDGVLIKYKGNGGDVTIPSSVTSIGNLAFEHCISLTDVTIPNSVTSIGMQAFCECTGLTSVSIPDSVISIGEGAFSGCTGLSSVTIPNSITNIEDRSFFSCTGLNSVAIPNSVTSIGNNVFRYCTSLASVTIPDSVTSIGAWAFLSTPWLKSQGDFAVVNGILITYQGPGGKVTIPDNVISIGDEAFSGCTSLTDVIIPDSVTDIGYEAFCGCTGLTNATIGDGVTNIGRYSFSVCTGLTNVTIGNGVTNIEISAFSGCTSLTSVTIPNSVISIGDAAFQDCTGLTSVTIGNAVSSIGFAAFSRCVNLISMTIPNSVTTIKDHAFNGCTGLKDVYYSGSAAQWKAIKIGNSSNSNAPLLSAAIHYNSTGTGQPTLPTVEDIPATGTAVARTQMMKLDGKNVEFQCYAVKNADGNETNYVKLRDLAMALNGTRAQFDVTWDGQIGITSSAAYKAVGGEGTTPYSGDQPYKAVSDTPVIFNGRAVKLTSFSITHQGGGYTYYKLRDLGQLLGFNVKWDGTSVIIETDKPYTGE